MLGQPGIDLVTPNPARHIQGSLGIAAGRDGPENLFQIVGIDIVIDHDDKSSMIACSPAEGAMGRSHGVAGVGLLERDDAHAPRVVDRFDVRDAECFQFVPNQNPSGGENAAAGTQKRRRAKDDRVVTI
jgi:hypothetical protein